MSRVALLLCDGCRKEPERFADVIRVYWPRRNRDGMSLEPLIHDLCSHRCMAVLLKPRSNPAEPCRPWCCSVALGATDGCDCLDEYPLDNTTEL